MSPEEHARDFSASYWLAVAWGRYRGVIEGRFPPSGCVEFYAWEGQAWPI